MKNKRRLFFRLLTVAALIVVAAVMMVIGRGHTVYFDNKALSANGEDFAAFQRAEIYVGGERVARLSKKERGMASNIGQSFSFSAEITKNKGDDPQHYDFTIRLPYGIDGVIVNLPAFIAGQPDSVWLSEFVPAPTVEEPDEELPTDEFEMGDM